MEIWMGVSDININLSDIWLQYRHTLIAWVLCIKSSYNFDRAREFSCPKASSITISMATSNGHRMRKGFLPIQVKLADEQYHFCMSGLWFPLMSSIYCFAAIYVPMNAIMHAFTLMPYDIFHRMHYYKNKTSIHWFICAIENNYPRFPCQ